MMPVELELNWNYLQTAGSLGRRDGTCCVRKAVPLTPCLVHTYALLKLAQIIPSGNSASTTDGREHRHAREPLCSSGLNIRDRALSKNLEMAGCPEFLYFRYRI